MTRVTYTADGGHYRVGGHGFDPDDTKDVDDELADYLADHDDFDVEEAGDEETDAGATNEDGTVEKLPEPEDITADESEICGEEMSDGETCERPADECQYHGDDEDGEA